MVSRSTKNGQIAIQKCKLSTIEKHNEILTIDEPK